MTQHVMSRRQMLAEGLAALAVARLSYPSVAVGVGGARGATRHGKGTMDLTVQDSRAGLASIVELRITNGTIEVPPFAPGTKDPVVLTAKKTDPRKPTSWSFVTIDMNGRRRRWA